MNTTTAATTAPTTNATAGADVLDLQPVEVALGKGEVIDQEAAQSPLASVAPQQSLRDVAFSRFGDWRKGAEALIKEVAETKFDIQTPAGLTVAKELRKKVRQPRYSADKVVEEAKKEMRQLGKDLEKEADLIAKKLEPTETALHNQITTREKEIETEKEARKQAEAARQERHRANLDALNALLPTQEQALAMGSTRIQSAIEKLEAFAITPEAWEEFAVEAQATKTTMLIKLRAWCDLARAHEAQARQQKLLELSGLVMGVFGKPAANIQAALERAEAVPTDAETWGEGLLAQVEMTKGQTVNMLRQMLTHAEAKERAAAEAAAQAQREEQERAAAAAAQAQREAEAEAARAAAQIEPSKAEAVAVEVVAVAPTVEVQQDGCKGCGECTGACHDEQPQAVAPAPVIEAAPAPVPAPMASPVAMRRRPIDELPTVDSLPVWTPTVTPPAMSQAPIAADAAPTPAEFVKLGEFNAELAVCSVDAEQLAALGFQHQSVPGSKGKHYPKAQRVAIGNALIQGIRQAIARWEAEQQA